MLPLPSSVTVALPDVALRCLVASPAGVERSTVICAHGFPDCEHSFREQLAPLVAAGHRVVCPAMRGYAPSDEPTSRRYDAAALGDDLVRLADHFSPRRPVHLVGHDWGAVAAYAATALAPERFDRLVTMAVPHLRVAGPRFFRPAQLRRSWYMALFQLPVLAERSLLANDLALVDRLWRDWSPGWARDDDHVALVKRAIAPNASAVLGYYRALRRGALGEARRLLFARTRVPSLYLHGADDGCIGAELCRGVADAYVAPVDVHVVAGAGHFVHLERPAEVNRLLLDFLAR